MRSPYDVILKPVISERSMELTPEKKYTFKVAVDANKTEIKQAVEEIFEGVEVKKVNVANYDGKLKSAEILLHPDGSFDMIRRAETVRDYFATFDFCDILKDAKLD